VTWSAAQVVVNEEIETLASMGQGTLIESQCHFKAKWHQSQMRTAVALKK
jgi:hypothetical protein